MNKIKRIGVLGGTFDPVHLGHKALGEAAIKEARLDKLIIMPAKVQPFKRDKRTADEHHRKAMAELAFSGNQSVEVSDYEINNSIISYTYDTFRYLKEAYPQDKLYFIMGTDSFLQLQSWYKGTYLLEHCALLVSVRPGYKQEELEKKILEYKQKYNTEVIKIHTEMPDVSSTEVRARISCGTQVSDLISEEVERYIKANGLYR